MINVQFSNKFTSRPPINNYRSNPNKINTNYTANLTPIKADTLSFGSSLNVNKTARSLMPKFNKPNISQQYLQDWITQFPEEDRKIAVKLIKCVDYITYPDIMEKAALLHKKLVPILKSDGFDTTTFKDVDFTRMYTAKSGDMASYFYKKANKMQAVNFKTIEALQQTPPAELKDKALIILDDYAATGMQFFVQHFATKPENVALYNQYKKIYFAPIIANEQLPRKFEALANNNVEEVANYIFDGFESLPEVYQLKGVNLIDAISKIKDKLKLVHLETERPILQNPSLSPKEREQMGKFFEKYGCETPYGVGNSQAHTVLFYTTAANCPDIIWNPELQKRGIMPLFYRDMDLSYSFKKNE